ncbi:cobalamin-independent methionine synthase II family protein [Sporichthya sp.]|uniref:cobalamin-independent methionine synthase II family protein n=1 Tax=Sporichthya sp. TaxID=65475 RepID=UPI0017F5DF2F|nr:cobalamin-independent methionine synthase II family protein [Sporichthya sp.]MBA3742192.1 cobalamin-independent methionine synthase II family protein [Sporichthya sp.]
MRVGSQDILIPTMMVGNYPKPRWFSGNPNAAVPFGEYLPDSISFETFEDCIAAMVNDQERAGLDVISDARVLGGDSPYAQIVEYFVERLGYDKYGPPLQLPIYSTMYSPTINGPITRKVPLLLKQLRAVKKFTDKPIKLQYPGLNVLTMGSNNLHYSEIKEVSAALAKAFNEEFKQVAEAGADIIQIDEFGWHYGLSLGDFEIEHFNAMTEGVDAQFVAHVCWGNYLGTKGYLPSGPMHGDNPEREGSEYIMALRDEEGFTARSKACFPRATKLEHLHALNFETANTGPGELKPLGKAKYDGNFVAGVIDVRSVEIETATAVAERIRACLEYVAPEKLGVTTDCGLINLPRIVAFGKLRALVEGAKIVREEIKAKQAADAGVVA